MTLAAATATAIKVARGARAGGGGGGTDGAGGGADEIPPLFDVVNGLQAFGFSNPHIQALLREAGAGTGLVDVPAGMEGPNTPARSPTGDGGGAAGAAGQPSLAPSFHPWLAPPVTPAQAQQMQHAPQVQQVQQAASEVRVRPIPPDILPVRLPSRAASMPVHWDTPAAEAGSSIVDPSAPRILLTRAVSCLPPVHASPLAAPRPQSRSRRRPASAGGGRGWTAFTAYGLETRDAVRVDNPWASSTEVEKVKRDRYEKKTKKRLAMFWMPS
jgi:hypothetical protein